MISEFPKTRKTFSSAVLVYRICATVLETKCAPVNLLRPTHKLALGRTSASGGRSTSSVQVSDQKDQCSPDFNVGGFRKFVRCFVVIGVKFGVVLK